MKHSNKSTDDVCIEDEEAEQGAREKKLENQIEDEEDEKSHDSFFPRLSNQNSNGEISSCVLLFSVRCPVVAASQGERHKERTDLFSLSILFVDVNGNCSQS